MQWQCDGNQCNGSGAEAHAQLLLVRRAEDRDAADAADDADVNADVCDADVYPRDHVHGPAHRMGRRHLRLQAPRRTAAGAITMLGVPQVQGLQALLRC